MKKKILIKVEKYFFFLILGLNLIPVLSYRFFPTFDGPAHLYNSNLINSLLFLKNEQLQLFFIFNSEPVPNWTGHFILSFVSLMFPAFIAEKAVLLFYLIGLPLAFRALINTVSPHNRLFSYLIFPFTYSLVFFFGFYNFSIALVFLLIVLNYWIKNEGNLEKLTSFKGMLILFVLILFTYFSHLFVFSLLLLLIGIHIVIMTITEYVRNKNLIKKVLFESIKKGSVLLFTSFIPFVLLFFYFYLRTAPKEYSYVDFSELIEWLSIVRPIIGLDLIGEAVFTKYLFFLFVLLLIVIVAREIYVFMRNSEISVKKNYLSLFSNLLSVSGFWLLTSVIFLILYFKMPDSDGFGGFVSLRLGLMFFIFLLIWFSTQKFSRWLVGMAVVVSLYVSFNLNKYYVEAAKDLSRSAVECNNAVKYIPENSIVLPLYYSENWLHRHFSNYLGIEKPMVILENYECETDFFPLHWNEDLIPNTMLGNISAEELPCIKWKSNKMNPPAAIDFVFVMGNINSGKSKCNIELSGIISSHYELVYETLTCKLYQNKALRSMNQ